jgi:hypothetical protein
MSWDKQTIIISEIDSLISLLSQLGVPYGLEKLGNVADNGTWSDPLKALTIRVLTYSTNHDGLQTIVEQMQRTIDCDTNDTLVSIKNPKDFDAKSWKLEICSTDDYNKKETFFESLGTDD